MPAQRGEVLGRLARARFGLTPELGREPSLGELSRRCGVPVRTIRRVQESAGVPVSLDTRVGETKINPPENTAAGEDHPVR